MAFDPKLTNSGNYDAYVFMEVTLPDQTFSLSEISSDWHPLTSVTDKTIYYYGTSSDLTELAAAEKSEDDSISFSQTSPLCSGITLGNDTDLKQGDYEIEATGYAIQTDNINNTSPEEVWDMIGDSE